MSDAIHSTSSHRISGWHRQATVWLGLGLVIGGAGGFFFGRHVAAPTTSAVASAATGSPGREAPGWAKNRTSAGGAAGGTARGTFIVDDPARAFRDLLSITDVTARHQALTDMLKSVPPEKLPEVIQRFAEFLDKQEFEDEIGGLVTALSTFEVIASHVANSAPEATFKHLLESRINKLDDILPFLLRQWAAHDFQAALAFFDHNLSSEDKSLIGDCAEGLAREYVKVNPKQAFDWIARLPPGERDESARGAFQTLSHRDSELALRLVVERTDMPDRPGIARGLAEGWAKMEPEKAFQWALGLPTDISKRATAGAFEHWCERDFQAAADSMRTLAPETQADLLPALAARADAEKAATVIALLDKQPEGEARAEVARVFMGRWAAETPEGASEWLAAQPAGPSRDHAAASFAQTVRDNDPEAALEWTVAINDSQIREKYLAENYSHWLKKDADAARAWIESSATLTAQDRESLRHHVRPK